jgi:hypothetical protein
MLTVAMSSMQNYQDGTRLCGNSQSPWGRPLDYTRSANRPKNVRTHGVSFYAAPLPHLSERARVICLLDGPRSAVLSGDPSGLPMQPVRSLEDRSHPHRKVVFA